MLFRSLALTDAFEELPRVKVVSDGTVRTIEFDGMPVPRTPKPGLIPFVDAMVIVADPLVVVQLSPKL